MTLSETLVALAVATVVLAAIALGINTARNDLKQRQTWTLLSQLDRAASAYQQSTGQYPDVSLETQAFDDARRNIPRENCWRILRLMFNVPASREILNSVNPLLRMGWAGANETGGPPWTTVDDPTANEPLTTIPAPLETGFDIQDSWGRRLRCLTHSGGSPAERNAVIANGGKPIFISAGPDGNFGQTEIAAAADNMRSDAWEVRHLNTSQPAP